MKFSVITPFLLISLAGTCHAQDRRQVSEPRIPKTCIRLDATLELVKGELRAADEQRLDTQRMQQALDHCNKGEAVELAASHNATAFLAGPLSLPASVTLLVDAGVTLFASRDPKLYEKSPGSCGLVNDEPAGCKPLISVDHAPHAAIMGDGTIDGRGGATLLGSTVTWWQLAEQARKGGRQQVPRIVIADYSDDFTLYRITLRNSPNFHVVFDDAQGFTVWGARILAPQRSRNTDGIDPGSASDITITHTVISTGDDHVALKGSGTGVQHVSVFDNHFYAGHGMSIGSETFAGVSDILVRNLTIDGADNGLRIKSNIYRGGLVEHVVFEDVCIRDTANPIVLDTRYSFSDTQEKHLPLFRDVIVRDVSISGGGKLAVDGVDASHATAVRFDNVRVDTTSAYKPFAAFATVSYGPGPVDFRFTGDGVTSTVLKPETHPAKVACNFPAKPGDAP